MFARLIKTIEKPKLYSRYSADILWTSDHLAQKMLETHLSQETPLASRPMRDIEQAVQALHQIFDFQGRKICDLGCGPGLYAEKIAKLGGQVSAIDFSANSIKYARQIADKQGLKIEYQIANYLKQPLPEKQDIITLVYFDLCVLSPAQRQTLYRNIHSSLTKGGVFIFDVLSSTMFDGVSENALIARNYMDGFWSGNDYITIHKTHRYEEQRVSLDHFSIIEENKQWEVFNWFKYFDLGEIEKELNENGFEIQQSLPPFSPAERDTSFALAVKKTET